MVRGVLVDGAVNDSEASGLRVWLSQHPEATEHFPGRELSSLLSRIFADGAIDPGERRMLHEYLNGLLSQTSSGARVSQEPGAGQGLAVALFDDPPPEVGFSGNRFVFTGEFAYGSRSECAALVQSLGGVAASSVSGTVDFVVVGEFGSENWLTSSYGRKLQKAVDLRSEGVAISVIREQHWLAEAYRSPGATA